MDEHDFPDRITEAMSPQEALAWTIAFLDTGPDDDRLCNAALTIGEVLVDWHWEVLEEEIYDLVARRSDARKMMSCCRFDLSVPDRVTDRILSYLSPEEEIGRQPG